MAVARILLVVAVAVSASCAPTAFSSSERVTHASELADLVKKKNPAMARADADRFATKAFDVCVRLREERNVVVTPWLNNVLVNFRVQERGLCYHWAFDLYNGLVNDLPPGMRMTLVDSYRGHPSKEHNAVSFHASDQHWSKGILLDGWTYAGNLDFYPLEESDVPWKFYANHP